jgi:glutathione peroxidase
MKTLLITLVIILLALVLIKRKDMTWRQSFLKTVYPLVMLKAKLFPNKKEVQVNRNYIKAPASFYTLSDSTNTGAPVNFNDFKGKKILIVNTASNCGYTAQYDQLEELHKQHKELVILAFPANDFKAQEQNNDAGIAEFCKVNFGITFPLMQKSRVIKGAEQNPVFQWLTQAQLNGWCDQQPIWNFNKYLIDEDGVLIGFFAHTVSPLDKKIVSAL